MSRTAPTRPLDAVYDPVYTVSHSSGGGLRKGGLAAGGARPGRGAPVSNQQQQQQQQNDGGARHVSGPERAKFFQRPILPHLDAEPPEVLLAPSAPPQALPSGASRDDAGGPTRSIGIQTMYRDSEAQTDPYTPDYTLPVGARGPPEVLTLLGLRHQRGLPAGRPEIELIDRNRHKRAFEASLPPMTDEASFLLRKAMMETQETREWAYREAEIDALHAQRIGLLQQALQERDRENEALAEQRLEALRQRLVHDKENALERIQQERVAALRKLTKRRQHGHATSPRRELRRDIIGEYTDFASRVYAPVTRGGKAGKTIVHEVGIERPQFQELEQLHEFEARIPARLLASAPTRHKPADKIVRTAKERKQAAVEAHLLKMESLIKQGKDTTGGGGNGGDGEATAQTTGSSSSSSNTITNGSPSSLLSRKRAQQQQQQLLLTRPPTPDYALQHAAEDDAVEDAVRLVQTLVRGRAVQNMMFEGKARRAELIAELRASDEAAALVAGEHGALSAASVLEDEETRVAAATRRKAEGEVVSELLDVLYKELDRSREVAKQKAFVTVAAEERRRREVEEGGRRQAEDLLRAREDEVFRRIERVHQETAQDFIDDLVDGVVQAAAHEQALGELEVLTGALGPMVTALEAAGNSDELVVKELVASFLLPQVRRAHVRHQLAQEEQKYVTAAHALLREAVARVPHDDDARP